MFNKLFLAFIACATLLAVGILFFQNNKGLLPSQQSPWSALSFKEPADPHNLDFYIQNNSPEPNTVTYTITNEHGDTLETNKLSLTGGEKRLVQPAVTPDANAGRITIEVRDDLTTQKIYR